MEESHDNIPLLMQRIMEEDLETSYDPPGDGMCFYASAAYQISSSPNDVHEQAKGSDKLGFICDTDIGQKVPDSWDHALNLLKDNYANHLITKTLPDVLHHTVVIITVSGTDRDEYIKTFEPTTEESLGTLYFGHTGNHYLALRPIQTKDDQKKEIETVTQKFENVSLEDNSQFAWLQDHPWENEEPKQKYELEDIFKSEKYKVGDKWLSGQKKNLKKIVNELPDFITEMEIPSTFSELKQASNTPPRQIYEDSIKEPKPKCINIVEIFREKKGNLKQSRKLPADDTERKYSAWPLPERNVSSTSECIPSTIVVEGYMLKISIPNSKKVLFPVKDDVCTPNVNESSFKRWIFVPSYMRASCALFDWSATGIDEEQTIRIVVVRPSQFEGYVKYCGYLLPIVRLPDDVIGVGYARYWIQKIATSFGLEYIWMIDDSIKTFYEVKPVDKPDDKKKGCDERKRNFREVFEKIEGYFKDNDKKLAAMSPARFRGGQPGQEAFTCKPPLIAVYLNLKLINEKNVTYRPQLSVLEDVIFGAECAKKELLVLRWKRIQLYDMGWQNTGAAIYSSSKKKSKSDKKQTPNKVKTQTIEKPSARRALDYRSTVAVETENTQKTEPNQQSTLNITPGKTSQNPSQQEKDSKLKAEAIKQSAPKRQPNQPKTPASKKKSQTESGNHPEISPKKQPDQPKTPASKKKSQTESGNHPEISPKKQPDQPKTPASKKKSQTESGNHPAISPKKATKPTQNPSQQEKDPNPRAGTKQLSTPNQSKTPTRKTNH